MKKNTQKVKEPKTAKQYLLTDFIVVFTFKKFYPFFMFSVCLISTPSTDFVTFFRIDFNCSFYLFMYFNVSYKASLDVNIAQTRSIVHTSIYLISFFMFGNVPVLYCCFCACIVLFTIQYLRQHILALFVNTVYF